MFYNPTDYSLWDKYGKPQPVDIKTGSIYDYYDVFEELGTWVHVHIAIVI